MADQFIFIIDDDYDLCESIERLLSHHGFLTVVAHSSNEIWPILSEKNIDLILLDIVLPGGEDGIELCKRIRTMTKSPIIMLTGIISDVERIIALEMGADAYLTKPFNARVLMAQIHSCLRRFKSAHSHELPEKVVTTHQIYYFNGWRLNVTARSLHSPVNQVIKLTSAEYTLLHTFVTHPQCVLSRDRLLETISVNSASLDRSVDILISRLRAKIETDSKNAKIIKTVRNMGYILACEVIKETNN